MKPQLDRTKASFKLDLIETVAADPIMTTADLSLIVAFTSVMEWPSRKAWLSSTLAQAKTGLSERQVWISRARLLGGNDAGRQYLEPVHGTQKVATFRLINPWRDDAREHIAAIASHLQAVERSKKARSRAKKPPLETSGLSLQSVQGHNVDCPCNHCSPVPATIAVKYPSMSTGKKKYSRGENDHGSEVAPITVQRRSIA